MKLTFAETIAFHQASRLYPHEIEQYRRDSKRTLRAHWYRKLERTRTFGFLVIAAALITLPFRHTIKARTPEISLLLAAVLATSHYVYA